MQMTTSTSQTTSRRMRSVAAFGAMAVLASACGSTAHRDMFAIDDAQVGGPVVAAPITGEPDPSNGFGTTDPEIDSPESPDASVDPGTDGGGTGSAPPASTPGSLSSPSSPSSPTTPSSGPSTSPTSPATGSPSSAPSATANPNANPDLPAPGPQRGVTATEINVGFVKLGSFRALSASLGFTASETGDVDGQINAVANWINANGGIAGRNVKVFIREYTQEEATPEEENQICNALADDNNVFAVVLQGQIYASTRACYAKKKVLTFDPSPFVFDDDLYNENAPYYWSPSYPNYSRVVKTLVPALSAAKYFDPMATRGETATRLGILHWDETSALRVLETDLKPALQAAGVDLATVVTQGVDGSSVGTIQTGLGNAVTRFQAEGVNRIVFIGGSPLAPFFYLNADSAGYFPRYGVTTLDAPRHTARGTTPNQMKDAVGIGFNPVNDVYDDKFAFPRPDGIEQKCLDIMALEGHTFEARLNAQSGLAYCEAMLLLYRGAQGLGDKLGVQNWATRVEQSGTKFASATALTTAFGPGRHDGGQTWRPVAHDQACRCFSYTGPSANFR